MNLSTNDVIAIAFIFFIVMAIASAWVSVTRTRARAENIKNAGWPPSRLDADGDPVGWTNE